MPEASILFASLASDGREMYAEFLRLRGFVVTETDDAMGACVLAGSVDAIVTEIRLRGDLDGVSLIQRLRADDRMRRKPIIVLTASTFLNEAQRAQAAGCDLFLTKPCLPDALVGDLLRLLPMRGARSVHAGDLSRCTES